MAPLPVILDCFRVVLRWTPGPRGQNPVNVMHFLKTAGAVDDIFSIIDSHVTAGMWAHTNTTVGVQYVDVTPLDGSSGTKEFVTGLPSKWKGTQADTDQVIPNTCALVKLGTGLRGRSHRGRIYLPNISEGQAFQGLLNTPTHDSMQTAWSAFMTAIAGDSLELAVASYKLGTAAPVTSTVVESLLATQRRRMRA